MGAGGSTSPSIGVPVNPRLHHADQSVKRNNEQVLLDAPSLVKLQPGTIRYRYLNDGEPVNEHRLEKPHEGQNNLNKKGGYFYHTRLKDYSIDQDQEEAWKFCYVYKGASKTRQKQVYYVFGKGLKTNEKGFIEPNYQGSTDCSDDKPEKFYKYHGHLYYDIELTDEVETLEEITILGDGKAHTEPNQIRAHASAKDRISLIKRKLAIKMFKPASHFHLFLNGSEMKNEDTVQNVVSRSSKRKSFVLLLVPR